MRWRSSRLPPAAVVEPLDHGGEERPGRSAGRARADLLVVEQGDHRHVVLRRLRPARGQRGGRGPAGHLVVEAPAGQERAVAAEHRGGLDVVEAQVPPRRVGGPGPGGDPLGEVLAARRAPDRREVSLAIEQQAALVDLPVEVDGELRHAGDRFALIDEGDRPVGHDEPAGDSQIAVEPAVEEHGAVDLHAELAPSRPFDVRSRFDPQTGRVRVGADDAQRRRARPFRLPPGDERSAADGVAGAGSVAPRVALVERGEPRAIEDSGR